jgi:hypothetical protein
VEGSEVIVGMNLKRILEPLLLSLFPGHHEVSRSPPPCSPTMMHWAITGPRQQGQMTMDWNHEPKIMKRRASTSTAMNILTSYKLSYLRYFVTITESWLTQFEHLEMGMIRGPNSQELPWELCELVLTKTFGRMCDHQNIARKHYPDRVVLFPVCNQGCS